MNNILVQQVVAGIAVKDHQVLLVKAKHGIATPGGKVGITESFTEALAREVFEETGLKVLRVGRFMGVDVQPTYHCHVFAMEVSDGEPVAGDDATEAWWGSPMEVLNSKIPRDYPWILDVMHNGVGGNRHVRFNLVQKFGPSVTLEEKNRLDDQRSQSFTARFDRRMKRLNNIAAKFQPEADPKMNNTQPKWPIVVGQHWKSKDKRRVRVVEVMAVEGDIAKIKGPSNRTVKIKTKELTWRYELVVEPAKLA